MGRGLNKAVSASLGLVVAMTLVAATAGLGCGGSSNSGSISGVGAPTTSTTSAGRVDAALTRGEGLSWAKQRLADTVGVPTADLRLSTLRPESKGADAVLLWAAGRAEVDSASGRIYLVSVVGAGEASLDPDRSPMNEVLLQYEALRVPAQLGWEDGMLATLGFRQNGAGLSVDDGDLFFLEWSQHDREDMLTDGYVEVCLDSRTGDLVSFSLSVADEAPDVSGILGVGQAMDIAETCIFLKTTETRIPLAGDGSLVLRGKTVTKELTVFQDKKLTRGEPVLTWVIFLSGATGDTSVGGTVYIDATTGRVLDFRPLAED